MTQPYDPTECLRSLGSVETLQAAAARGLAPASRPRLNTHIHLPPNFSAFTSVDQAVDAAADEGVRVLGVGNYYDYRVYGDFVRAAARRKVFPLFGTEVITIDPDFQSAGVKVNDPGNPGRVYICGKAMARFAPPSPTAQVTLDRIRRADEQRMAAMCTALAAHMARAGVDTGLDADAVIARVARRHDCDPGLVVLQERHIAQAFQECLCETVAPARRATALTAIYDTAPTADLDDPVAVQNELRSRLLKAGRPCYVPEDFVGLDTARDLIRDLGGIDCYPILADGVDPISPFEAPVETLIGNLRELGFHLVEVITVRNDAAVLTDYVTQLRAAGFLVAAGTEHNTLARIPVEPRCRGGLAVPEPVQAIFWESVCVMAAHQFLVAHEQTGYVDRSGTLHPDYADTEQRITAFARLGAAVIQTTLERKTA